MKKSSRSHKVSQEEFKPTPEQISTRAELVWRTRGCPTGMDSEIWLDAERQLIEENREVLQGTSR